MTCAFEHCLFYTIYHVGVCIFKFIFTKSWLNCIFGNNELDIVEMCYELYIPAYFGPIAEIDNHFSTILNRMSLYDQLNYKIFNSIFYSVETN